MTERMLTGYFHKYIKSHPRSRTETYEFKMCKGGTFNFKQVHDHQVTGLLTSREGLWHKIADTTAINGFTDKKPFDALFVVAEEAYVVPIFYKPRKYKIAFLIPIERFTFWLRQGVKSIKMIGLEIIPDIEKISF